MQVLEFMGDLAVDDLPGVGWALKQRLEKELGITRVRQVGHTSHGHIQ
jgi:DNA repair protein REV1